MLSVVVVNWNTRSELRTCLESLANNPSCEKCEVIVVDNDSRDGSAEMVEREFPRVVLVRSGGNLGYAAGNNRGLARAFGDAVLTLNPDTEIPAGALDAALVALRADERRGYVGVRLVGLDGETQSSVRGFPEYGSLILDMAGVRRNGYRLPDFPYDQDGPAPQPMGTFLLFSRAALDAVGGRFDESFPIFFNEVDLLLRIREAGFEGWFLGTTHIRHVGGAGTRQVRKKMIWESHRSLVRYMARHRRRGMEWVPWLGLAILSPVVAFARARGYDPGFVSYRHDLLVEHPGGPSRLPGEP